MRIFLIVPLIILLSGYVTISSLPDEMYFLYGGDCCIGLSRSIIEEGLYFIEEEMEDPVKGQKKFEKLYDKFLEKINKKGGCPPGEICS